MYFENDMTPRDRISDDMLRRILNPTGDIDSPSIPPQKEKPQTSSSKIGWGLDGYPLASVYAPLQRFQNLYDIDNALRKGTLFAELNFPFMGDSIANKGGNCCG